MRVLIYTHAFGPSIGGVETYTRLLAEGLTKHNIRRDASDNTQVTVVTRTPAQPNYDSQFPFRVVRRPGLFRLLNLVLDTDVVQLAGPALLPMILAIFLRRPLIIEQHLYQPVCPNGLLLYEPTQKVCPQYFMTHQYGKCLQCNRQSLGWLKSLKMLLLTFPRRWLCRRADVNVAVTSHVERRLALPRSQVIYHGLPDPLGVQVAAPTVTDDSRPERMSFAYVGRLVSEKGLPLLIEAARSLKEQGYDFQLKFVGDGPERRFLQATVSELGLEQNVKFTGFLDGKGLEEGLRDVAVVVMPSIWEETAGLAAIEQMFRGRLVIASEIAGLGEIVGPTGLKFPPGNWSALANCMKQVLDNPDMVRQLGERARQRALDSFMLERMVDEHRSVYHRLSKS